MMNASGPRFQIAFFGMQSSDIYIYGQSSPLSSVRDVWGSNIPTGLAEVGMEWLPTVRMLARKHYHGPIGIIYRN